MINRQVLFTALQSIKVARRDALEELDAIQAQLLSSAEVPTSEEIPASLAGIVRVLDNAARDLADAIRTVDRVERLKAPPAPPTPQP